VLVLLFAIVLEDQRCCATRVMLFVYCKEKKGRRKRTFSALNARSLLSELNHLTKLIFTWQRFTSERFTSLNFHSTCRLRMLLFVNVTFTGATKISRFACFSHIYI